MHSRTELFVVDVTQRTEFELQLTYTKSAYYRLKYVVPPLHLLLVFRFTSTP